LAICTSFFYEVNEQLFLISNWHTFSGRDIESGKPLANHAGIPDRVGLYLTLEGKYIKRGWYDVFLSDNYGPLWYEHPELGRKIDVAALPVSIPEKYNPISINKMPQMQMKLEVSHDVFVLGYPKGLIDVLGLPIWKRATVATEPGTSSPLFFVDTATRQGMSGSPVVHRYRGFYKSSNFKGIGKGDWLGEGSQFIGVYSGRIGESEFEAQLGKVWKVTTINEIIEGRTRGKVNVELNSE
jgi:hypothetical protein